MSRRSENGVHAQFFRELDQCAAALHKFNPDLVVVFGPDHFNGFFYELMPMFCIGTAAQGTKDWHLEAGPLRVPRELALALRAPSAFARHRRGGVARDEGRSRHHHPAVQAHRRARPLQRAADLHQLRRRSAPLVQARAHLRQRRSANSSPTRTCASPSSAPAACRTIRRRRASR